MNTTVKPQALRVNTEAIPAAEIAVALFRRYFLNRTDRLCVRRPNGKPCPIEGDADLDDKLRAHLLGDAAPKVTVRCTTQDGNSWEHEGRFRLGSYSPDLDNRSRYGVIDGDGGTHSSALADPLGVALAILDWLEQRAIVAYLESSGSATGWHPWIFLSEPVPAWKIRKLLFAALPLDAQLKDGTSADAKANRGLEVFPKQDAHAEKDGVGNQVWLPWWSGAKPGGNLFYQVNSDGELAPYSPEDFVTNTEADLDAALKQIPNKPAGKSKLKIRTSGSPAERDSEGRVSTDVLLERALNRVSSGQRSGRNDSGHWLACQLRDNRYSKAEAEPVMRAYVDRAPAGEHTYTKAEASASLRNAFKKPPREPWGNARRLSQATPSANGDGAHPPTGEGVRPEGDAGEVHLTDLGNARRVVARHGADMHFCHPWKQFLIFDGRRWAADDTAAAARLVKETQATLYRWAAEQLAALAGDEAGEEDERKSKAVQLTRVLQHCLKWEDARRIAACLELIRSEPGIPIRPVEMDCDPWVLNVTNGTIDLRTSKLREHRREDLLTKLAPVAYDSTATCPLWDRCLNLWMGGRKELGEYLRRVVGYALTADVSEQVLFFLYGTGANGKSTFLSTLGELLGDYACQAVSELLTAKNNEAHPTERADLFSRRFVATIEADEGKRMAEALMKQLTGCDRVSARKMRQDFFEMTPTWKIFLAANHKPVIRGTDFAVWRRIRLIPFTFTIQESAKDKDLPKKLRTELPGILAWAIRGCLDWQGRGLDDPKEVIEATAAYQREQDSLANFFADCCVIAEFAKVKSSVLLKAYQEWSGDKTITQQAFRVRMNDKGFHSGEGTGGSYFYEGIGLPASESEREWR